jgi:hypothetical protein
MIEINLNEINQIGGGAACFCYYDENQKNYAYAVDPYQGPEGCEQKCSFSESDGDIRSWLYIFNGGKEARKGNVALIVK